MHAHVTVVMHKLLGSEFARTKERFETYSEKEAAKTPRVLTGLMAFDGERADRDRTRDFSETAREAEEH